MPFPSPPVLPQHARVSPKCWHANARHRPHQYLEHQVWSFEIQKGFLPEWFSSSPATIYNSLEAIIQKCATNASFHLALVAVPWPSTQAEASSTSPYMAQLRATACKEPGLVGHCCTELSARNFTHGPLEPHVQAISNTQKWLGTKTFPNMKMIYIHSVIVVGFWPSWPNTGWKKNTWNLSADTVATAYLVIWPSCAGQSKADNFAASVSMPLHVLQLDNLKHPYKAGKGSLSLVTVYWEWIFTSRISGYDCIWTWPNKPHRFSTEPQMLVRELTDLLSRTFSSGTDMQDYPETWA